MAFKINNVEKMTLASDGKVGIGKTDPGTELEVVGTIKGTTVRTDGTASMTGGSITDGTATLSGGNLTKIGTIGAAGDADLLTLGANSLKVAGNVEVDNITLKTFAFAANSPLGITMDANGIGLPLSLIHI